MRYSEKYNQRTVISKYGVEVTIGYSQNQVQGNCTIKDLCSFILGKKNIYRYLGRGAWGEITILQLQILTISIHTKTCIFLDVTCEKPALLALLVASWFIGTRAG